MRALIDARMVLLAAAAIAVISDACGRAPRVTVETREEVLIGRLESFDPRRGVRLSGDSFVRLDTAELLEIRFIEAPRRAQPPTGWLELVDQSSLPFDAITIDSDRVACEFTCADGLTVQADAPTSSIAAISFRGDQSRVETPEDTGIDLVLIKPRSGGAPRPVEGAIVRLGADAIGFALDADAPDDAVDVPWSRLAGLRFFRSGGAIGPPPSCVLTLSAGGRVLADRYEVEAGDTLRWESEHSEGQAPFDTLGAIDLSAGSVTPVAAWKKDSQRRESPSLGPPRDSDDSGFSLGYALDRSPLRLRWPDSRAPSLWPNVSVVREYDRGLAVRGGVGLTFRMPDGASRLRGVIGLDPATSRVGDAVVTILADEREVWSGRVNGRTEPYELNEPLEAPSRLTIRVDEGPNLDTGDHVHFVDLRVIQ